MSETPIILIVDDRPENLISLEAVLDSLPVQIQKAATADAALRFLLDHEVALVLLDVQMPIVDGFEAARIIRERERSKNTPIIFVTANDVDQPTVRKGYKLGAVDYIVKPFDPDIMRWKVSVFVELYQSREKERLLTHEHAERIHAEAEARRTRLLSDAVTALASSVDEDTVLERLAARLVPEFAECAAVFRPIKGSVARLRRVALFPHGAFAGSLDLETDAGPVVTAFREGHWVNAERLSYGAGELQSGLFLPLCGPRQTLGVLAMYRRHGNAFMASDQSFAEELGDRIRLAMANLALYRASEEANSAKDRFLAIVSHELRTPLTSIIGWTNVLLSKIVPPATVEKALQTILRNAHLQNNLIGDILDFSAVVNDKLSIDLQNVRIGEIVRESLEAIAPTADAKGVLLVCEVPGEEITIDGDTRRLHQLLTNLLSNAIKFTPKGGSVTVSVALAFNGVSISIRDTGIGIEPEFLSRVFDPFVQEDAASTRAYSGLGLGLAIVRRLTDLHHGTIRAESPGRGQGTTFVLTLPRKQAGFKAG